ncbi:MAG: hypothetical protein Q8T09_00675 [Candidatus Melainabacteria bacterium]|nr:hypothetical protein [Candidatus Melainabacteria bacterium]
MMNQKSRQAGTKTNKEKSKNPGDKRQPTEEEINTKTNNEINPSSKRYGKQKAQV